MNRLRRAALVAFCLHVIAAFGMAFVLRHGLETNSDLQERLSFLVNHPALWSLAWLTWTAAAVAILYFYIAFAGAHLAGDLDAMRPPLRLAVLLTAAGMGPDLAAQAIEIGVLPSVAEHAFSTTGRVELFLVLHRIDVMLSGYLANGLYSTTALILAWSTRTRYSVWVWSAGVAVGLFGLMLSAAALVDSPAAMLWTNGLLISSILIWLAGVAIHPVKTK